MNISSKNKIRMTEIGAPVPSEHHQKHRNYMLKRYLYLFPMFPMRLAHHRIAFSAYCGTRNSFHVSLRDWRPSGRLEAKRWASTSTTTGSISRTPVTWIDRFPAKWRPYLSLARADKPIGTLLLFYPCSR